MYSSRVALSDKQNLKILIFFYLSPVIFPSIEISKRN